MMRIIKVVSICFLMILASTTVHANVTLRTADYIIVVLMLMVSILVVYGRMTDYTLLMNVVG